MTETELTIDDKPIKPVDVVIVEPDVADEPPVVLFTKHLLLKMIYIMLMTLI